MQCHNSPYKETMLRNPKPFSAPKFKHALSVIIPENELKVQSLTSALNFLLKSNPPKN